MRTRVKLIKKLDIFILKNYFVLFAGTFCISLFVVMMQFLWKYVDELVGKGLTLNIIAKFFFYAGETLVPLALPLGVLLASLISFGNLGEKFELLAIKASGVSLIRTLRPLIIFNAIIAGISFYFQNKIVPQAEEDLLTLRWSILQTSPEVNIPVGVFYSGVPGLNMYVKNKDLDTGILYDVMIYNMQDGVNNAHIILADSGKMESSSDKTAMLLHLWNGEQFENLSNSGLDTHNVPYRRETFVNKHFIIDFNTNFTMEENEGIGRSASTKRMDEILMSIDSMKVMCDSMSVAYYNDMAVRALYVANSSRSFVYPPNYRSGSLITSDPLDFLEEDSVKNDSAKNDSAKAKGDIAEKNKKRKPHMATIPPLVVLQEGVKVSHKKHVVLDSVYNKLDNAAKQTVIMGALQRVNIATMSMDYNNATMSEGDYSIRYHWVQYWTKITMALACLIFFFIGAPLGAIIRKGGLGMPVILAVVIFIFYYIINTGGMRAGREGSIPVWFGMWLSSLVLTPMAIFLTVKSNNDSVMFNTDIYANFFRKLIGKRQKRHIARKEVIINDPYYPEVIELIEQLLADTKKYKKKIRRPSPLKYIAYIFTYTFSRKKDEEAENINMALEHIVDILSNSKDRKVLAMLNSLPILDTNSFRFYRRRRGDMRNIMTYGGMLKDRINEIIYGQN